MAWITLLFAGLFEVMWAVGLKYTQGFSRLWPTIFTLISMAASVSLLAIAMRELPLGTAYAVWTGIGVLGTTALGMVLFDESGDAFRLVYISFIVVGIFGLRVSSS